MPPVPRSRIVGGGGDHTPMNDTNTSFSFQIPGSMLKSSENLLADDSGDFFEGAADVDMSAGSPLKLRGNDLTQTTMAANTIARRVTRSQSRSPQKPQTKSQPTWSTKKSGAGGMTASSSGSSFPASMYPSLHEERLMEVEEMDDMGSIDGVDATDGMNDFRAPPVLEPIAAELNKPRSSTRRAKSRSPSKSKSKGNEEETSASNATATTNEFKSPALASMSAYLPPLSPDVLTSTPGNKLYPNAFNFGFSPQTESKVTDHEVPPRASGLGGGSKVSLREQGTEVAATATAAAAKGTGHTERKTPASRIERREKRVTSRSEKTEDLPTSLTTTTAATDLDTVGPISQPPHDKPPAPPSKDRETPMPGPADESQLPAPIHAGTKILTAINPFDALKKRVVSTSAASSSSSNANLDTTQQPDAGATVGASASGSSSNVSERLVQKKLGGGLFSFSKPPRNSNPKTITPPLQEPTAAPGASASIPASAVDRDIHIGEIREKGPSTTTTSILVESTQPVAATTAVNVKPVSSSTESKASRGTSVPPVRVASVSASAAAPASVTAKTMGGTERSAFEALKAGLGDKTTVKSSASSGGVDNIRADNHNRTNVKPNSKKRSSSDADAISKSGSRAMPGAYEMATDSGGGDSTSAAAALEAQAPPPRKRARRDSVMLGRAAATTATGSSSSMLRSRGSLVPSMPTEVPVAPHGRPTTAAVPPVTAPAVAIVNASTPTIMEEPEPAVYAAPASEAMDVDTDKDAGEVYMNAPPIGAVLPPTGEPALDVEAETATLLVPPPAPPAGPSAVPPADAERNSKALKKRKWEAEVEAQRRRDEAKREVRRQQQNALRKSLAVVAAVAAAATVVAAVAADADDGEEGEDEEEGDEDNEDEGGDGGGQGADNEEEDGEGEVRLPAPKFGAIEAADAGKVKAQSKGKARANTGEVRNPLKKRTRTTSTTTIVTNSTAKRSTIASSSKTTTARRAQVHAQAKASRKIATNSRISRSKEGASTSSAVAGPSSSSELQNHADTRTRSHSRTKSNVASTEVQGGPALGPSMQVASSASFATSSSSSSSSKSRPPFQVPLPATLDGEFAARADARREALRREKQRDPGESEGTTSANPATRSTSRTSSRNSNSGTAKKDKPPIPDFAAMHAAQAALLSRAKASLPPLTKPHGPALTTEARVKERAVFDAHVKEKEAEEERKREEERRRREEEEELEIRELRRRAVPKAHEVPEWYRDMPKKTKTTAGSGDQPSSSTS